MKLLGGESILKTTKKKNKKSKTSRAGLDYNAKLMILILSFLVFGLAVLVVMTKRKAGAEGGDSDSSTSFIPFVAMIPVWIAVFQKKRKASKVDEKRLKFLIVLGILFLLLGVFVFYLNIF